MFIVCGYVKITILYWGMHVEIQKPITLLPLTICYNELSFDHFLYGQSSLGGVIWSFALFVMENTATGY